VLGRFLGALSPRKHVRSAAWDEQAGRWANRYPVITPLAEVRPERPVAMHLFPPAGGGPRLWAFDFDSAGSGAAAAAAQAGELGLLLTAHGLPAVAVVSGPLGGRHLWTACEEPLPADLLGRLRRMCGVLAGASAAQSADFPLDALDTNLWANTRTGALRPPGAAHRAGGHAVLADQSIGEAITALSNGGALRGFRTLVAALEELAQAVPTGSARAGQGGHRIVARAVVSGRPLPPSVVGPDGARPPRREIIARADGTSSPALAGVRPLSVPGLQSLRRRLPTAADHSAHAWGVLLSLAAAGRTFDQVEQDVRDERGAPGLEYFRSARGGAGRQPRGEREMRTLLARQWELAVECAARLPPASAREHADRPAVTAEVRALMSRMEVDPERWRRPTGPADEAVLRAVALVALVSGRSEVALDVRRGSLLTGFSQQTVNVAIRDRLIPDGWLREVAPADPRRRLARVVAIARSHVCPSSQRHVCAADTQSIGSDTSGNAPQALGALLVARLRAQAQSQSASLWGSVGHHTGRTLRTVEDGATALQEIQERTGYSRRTVARHMAALGDLGLVRHGVGYHRTRKPLQAALEVGGHPDVAAERSVVFTVDRAVWQWWQAEERWLRAGRAEKWRRRRPDAQDSGPCPRRYPRTEQGHPDHAEAWRLEAQRLGVSDLWKERAQVRTHCVSGLLGPAAVPNGAGDGARRRRGAHPRSRVRPARSTRLLWSVQESRDAPLPDARDDPAPFTVTATSSTCRTRALLGVGCSACVDLRHRVGPSSGSGPCDSPDRKVRGMPTRTQNRTDLGEFLRTRRERIRPDHVGLPAGPRRRTRGLRREEVAVLAGLSPTWYTYLEQGRDIRASSQVVESLTRVLRLDDDERKYFYLLAHGQTPPVGTEESAVRRDAATDRVIGAMRGAGEPMYADNLYGDIVAWNDAASHWYTDFSRLPPGRRNMLWWVFSDPLARDRLVNWAEDAQDLVARFRLASATRPHDKRFQELTAAAWAASDDFRGWWPAHEVRDHHPRMRELRSDGGRTRVFELVALRTVESFHSVIFHMPVPEA
jgi:transcriptional regulator with XRE-family HTH domain